MGFNLALRTLLILPSLAHAWQISLAPRPRPKTMDGLTRTRCGPLMVDPWATNNDDTINTVIGAVTALTGAAAGVGLIAFTENAGNRCTGSQLIAHPLGHGVCWLACMPHAWTSAHMACARGRRGQ